MGYDATTRQGRAVRRVFLEFEKKEKVSVANLRGAARSELWRLSEGHISPEDITYVTNAVLTQLTQKGVEVV